MSLISGIESFLIKRVMTRFFVVFFISQNRKTLQGNPFVLCVRKILVAKKFMDKKGGVSIFSVERFSFHSAEEFRTLAL